MEEKRLFFGVEILSPWPQDLPKGRCLSETDRHMTLAFLGNTDYSILQTKLPSFPKPSFSIGFAGQFDTCLFLPKKTPHVVAWHIKWLETPIQLQHFQQELVRWLKDRGLPCQNNDKDFLPHVTICRQPFSTKQWQQEFIPLPLITTNIHLYESLGHSRYQPCWTYPLLAPFEEVEHTADIAFLIRGHTFQQLHQHAQTALAFKYPSIFPFLSPTKENMSIEDIVMDLNHSIGFADREIGFPLKAVSFHDKLIKEDNLLTWEMIVDV